ncbi:hypothetical protein ACIRQY_22575 [Streptomyces sp. NPDC101490]|uniref:hypothetical protein n=1 Tax=unclassified Streptomyces TaxID=2593676 RepID=UPI00331F1A2B
MSVPGFTAGSSVYGVVPWDPSYGDCYDEAQFVCRQQCSGGYSTASCSKCKSSYMAECMCPGPDCSEQDYCDENGTTIRVTRCKECDGSTTVQSVRISSTCGTNG